MFVSLVPVGLGLAVSALFWLALPFSIAFLPFAGLFIVAALAFGVGSHVAFPEGPSNVFEASRRTVRLVAAFMAPGLAATLALQFFLMSNTHVVVHRMEWSSGGTPEACGARTVLESRSCSALNRMVCSDEVARYLESTVGRTVDVRYSITEDFGRVWSYTIDAIGAQRVSFASDESIRKETDVDCVFHPTRD